MARRMNDESLLTILQNSESDAAHYSFGTLRTARQRAVEDYYQQPYGNEEDGWSQIVTSDVQDTIEWILPELIEVFSSTDRVVEFDPSSAAEVKGAEQATDACNYVFTKQNNGFLVLMTAFKDALMLRNGFVHWRKETEQTVEKQHVRGVSEMQVRMLESQGWERPDEDDIEQHPQPIIDPNMGIPVIDEMGQPMMGEPLLTMRMKRISERKVIKVEALNPETVLIDRTWASPELDDCPYVARVLEVTLSELRQMGFDDVDADELAASGKPEGGDKADELPGRPGEDDRREDDSGVDREDESKTKGWIRIEWVLADQDGDGIAERLEVIRLQERILSAEDCEQVPVATAIPILIQHQWSGMSIAETVSDIQKLRTELLRQVVNNAVLANNPRTTVLTDMQGAPLADIDDLLDSRPGGILRQKRVDAVGVNVTPFVGAQMFGMMEYIDTMREQRTGVSKQQQGLDPNALRPDKTAAEVMMTANAAKQRVKLIARMLAETLVKPMFKGILKLLSDGDMGQIAFKLRGEYVEMDPTEWRDSYNMTTNVGLGTGDKQQQMGILNSLFQTQMGVLQSPLGPMLLKPGQIYKTQAKMLDIAGFRNVQDFWTDPGEAPFPQPPPQPPEAQIKAQAQMQIEQAKLQASGQIEQMRMQQEAQLEQMRAQMQQQTDIVRQRAEAEQHQMKMQMEAELARAKLMMEQAKKQGDMEFQRWKAELDAATRIQVANISSKNKMQDAATEAATAEIGREVQQ